MAGDVGRRFRVESVRARRAIAYFAQALGDCIDCLDHSRPKRTWSHRLLSLRYLSTPATRSDTPTLSQQNRPLPYSCDAWPADSSLPMYTVPSPGAGQSNQMWGFGAPGHANEKRSASSIMQHNDSGATSEDAYISQLPRSFRSLAHTDRNDPHACHALAKVQTVPTMSKGLEMSLKTADSFPCGTCPGVFPTRKQFLRHRNTRHKWLYPDIWACKLCFAKTDLPCQKFAVFQALPAFEEHLSNTHVMRAATDRESVVQASRLGRERCYNFYCGQCQDIYPDPEVPIGRIPPDPLSEHILENHRKETTAWVDLGLPAGVVSVSEDKSTPGNGDWLIQSLEQ